jgi:hypothetical protein
MSGLLEVHRLKDRTLLPLGSLELYGQSICRMGKPGGNSVVVRSTLEG